MQSTLAILLLCVAAACGGSSKPAAAPAPVTPPAAKHHDMAPVLTKFHDRLAPLWHAPKGKQRLTDACNATDDLKAEAAGIVESEPPATSDGETWSFGLRELETAVAQLHTACVQDAGTEEAFEAVHNAFHALMDAAGGKHE